MSAHRLSKLQIKILHTLYTTGEDNSFELIEKVDNDETARIAELIEKGYIFANDLINLSTKEVVGKRYVKPLKTKRLRRAKLLSNVFGWEKFNKYNSECGYWKMDPYKKWRTGGYPPFYKQYQVSFTRSIQALAGASLVDLLMRFENPVSVFDDGLLARKLSIKARNHLKEREESLKEWQETFEKEKLAEPKYKEWTFDQWFDSIYYPIIFGLPMPTTTRRKVFESNTGHRNYRNTTWVRLTEKGFSKVQELNVKYRTLLSELTIRRGVSL